MIHILFVILLTVSLLANNAGLLGRSKAKASRELWQRIVEPLIDAFFLTRFGINQMAIPRYRIRRGDTCIYLRNTQAF